MSVLHPERRPRRRTATAGSPPRVRPPTLSELALWAQRRSHHVPGPLTGLARRLRGHIQASTSALPLPVDGWNAPLVGPPAGSFDLSLPGPGAPIPAWRSPAGLPTLRCLIATVDLDVGGMGEVVASLVRGLPGQGIGTSVLHLGSTTPGDPGRGSAGRLARELRGQGFPVTFAATEADGRRWLADNRPDVISAHIAPDWLFAAAEETGTPVVETLHMAPMPGAGVAPVGRRRGAVVFVTVSEELRGQLLADQPDLRADRVVTIPHGVAVDRLPEVDRDEIRARLGIRDELLFVSLARYSLEKNPYGLVQAFDELARSHPEARLLVAGRVDDPAYAQQVRRLVDRSDAGSHIHLRDHLPHPAALLAAADAVVVNSFFEGGPLVSMEALCMGTPVIMSDVGRAREQLGTHGRGGYLVPNPLGDLPVTWETIRTARFGPQANRGALVDAMEAMGRERDRWAAARTGLARDSRNRFDLDTSLRQHAAVLIDAAAAHATAGVER